MKKYEDYARMYIFQIENEIFRLKEEVTKLERIKTDNFKDYSRRLYYYNMIHHTKETVRFLKVLWREKMEELK